MEEKKRQLGDLCQRGFQCYACRNEPTVRKSLEQKFGEFECPRGLPIGASMEEMPQEAKDQLKIQKRRQKLMTKAPEIIRTLKGSLPPEALPLLDDLIFLLFPHGLPKVCKHMERTEKKVKLPSCACKTFRTYCHHPERPEEDGKLAEGTVKTCTTKECSFFIEG